MGILAEFMAMALAYLYRSRAYVLWGKFIAWIEKNPILAATGIGAMVSDFVGSIVNVVTGWFNDIRDEATTTAAEKKAEAMAFISEGIASGSQFLAFVALYHVQNINKAMRNIDPTHTIPELTDLTRDEFVRFVGDWIKSDIEKGGGSIITGDIIQKLRTGAIPSMGWAARGLAADSQGQAAKNPRLGNNQHLYARIETLSAQKARERALSRARQAKYRQTHKRKSHWVKK